MHSSRINEKIKIPFGLKVNVKKKTCFDFEQTRFISNKKFIFFSYFVFQSLEWLLTEFLSILMKQNCLTYVCNVTNVTTMVNTSHEAHK